MIGTACRKDITDPTLLEIRSKGHPVDEIAALMERVSSNDTITKEEVDKNLAEILNSPTEKRYEIVEPRQGYKKHVHTLETNSDVIVPINFRLPDVLKNKLEEASKAKGISIKQYLIIAVEDFLQRFEDKYVVINWLKTEEVSKSTARVTTTLRNRIETFLKLNEKQKIKGVSHICEISLIWILQDKTDPIISIESEDAPILPEVISKIQEVAPKVFETKIEEETFMPVEEQEEIVSPQSALAQDIEDEASSEREARLTIIRQWDQTELLRNTQKSIDGITPVVDGLERYADNLSGSEGVMLSVLRVALDGLESVLEWHRIQEEDEAPEEDEPVSELDTITEF